LHFSAERNENFIEAVPDSTLTSYENICHWEKNDGF